MLTDSQLILDYRIESETEKKQDSHRPQNPPPVLPPGKLL